MKGKRLIFSILLVLFSFNLAFSQEPTPNQKRHMNNAVLEVLDEYELNAGLYDKHERYRFSRLFESPGSEIICDLYNHNGFLSYISVKEYCDFIQDHCMNIENNVYNIQKDNIVFNGNEWIYNVILDRSITYTDENDILFPIQEKNARDFKMKFSFVFPLDLSECHIRNIQVLNNDEHTVLEDAYIFRKSVSKKTAHYNDEILIDGDHLTFNSFKQAYARNNEIELWDDDIIIKTEEIAQTDNYTYLQLDYQPKHFRLRWRNDLNPFSCFHVKGDTPFRKKHSFGYTTGIDIGYSFSLDEESKLAIYTGLGISFSNLKLQTRPFEYFYTISDKNDQLYDRHYRIDKASQSVSFKDLVIPVYMEYSYKFHKDLALFVDLGAKIYLNTNIISKPMRVTGNVSALLGEDEIQAEDNGFGEFDNSYSSYLHPVDFNRKNFDISIMTDLGLEYDLYQNMLFVEMKLGYEQGLMDTYQSDNNPFCDPERNLFPVIYSAHQKDNIAVRPLADCVSFNRQAFTLNLGIKIKL